MIILIKLIIAHIIGDFIIQPDSLVKKKNQGKLVPRLFWITIHSLIHGLLIIIVLFNYSYWKLALTVFFVHLIIDTLKSLIKKDNICSFIIDQAVHLLSLLIIWQIFTDSSFIESISNYVSFDDTRLWIVFLVYLIVIFPYSYLIGKATISWQNQLTDNQEGLKNAGRYIGMLERFLVLTFILLEEYQAIGFLIAAKSVFRFGDLTKGEDRKKTEYILIGTLISFSLTIIIGLFLLYIINVIDTGS
jgi:uncharacterized protein DUF3307